MARLARPGGPGVPAGTVRREGPGRPVLAPADPTPEVVPDHGPDVGSAQGGFHRHRACPGRSWRLPAVAPPIAGGVRTHGSPGDVRASTGAVLTGGAGRPGAVGTGGEHLPVAPVQPGGPDAGGRGGAAGFLPLRHPPPPPERGGRERGGEGKRGDLGGGRI